MTQRNWNIPNTNNPAFDRRFPANLGNAPVAQEARGASAAGLNLASVSLSQLKTPSLNQLTKTARGRLADQLATTGAQGKLLTVKEATQLSSFYSTLARTAPREEDLEKYNLLKETSELFINTVSVADLFVNRNYLDGLSGNPIVVLDDERHTSSQIQIREITKFVYDDEKDIVDYMTNVYAALHNANSTVMLILQGTETGVTMYLGLMKEGSTESNVSQAEYLLNDTFTGNFPGSSLGKKLTDEQVDKLMRHFTDNNGKAVAPSVACVTAIPSPRQNGNETRYQNISQFIDTMRGQSYTCMLVATPVNSLALTKRIQGYESLYSNLAPYANISIQHGINSSDSTQIGSSKSFSTSVSHAISISNSVSQGDSGSSSSSYGSSGGSFNSNNSYTNGWSHSTTNTRGHTDTNGRTETVNEQTGRTYTNGTSRNITVNFTNKHIADLLEQTEQHIKRLKESQNFGLWECAAYFLGKDSHTAQNAACAYKSLLVGDQGCMEKAYINIWDEKQTELQTLGVLEYLEHGMHPLCQLNLLAGQYREIVSPATFISGKDLPLFMGMPNKSVCGLPVVQMASFGRNIVPLKLDVPKQVKYDITKPFKLSTFKKQGAETAETPAEEEKPVTINLGKIFHRGRMEETEVNLNTKDLSKHCFVTGSTGSGKSNTMYCLLNALHEKGIAFMVVEPAKGEYKTQFGGLEGINIFTAQPNVNRLLKINPFKFPEKIHILEHMDRLLEIFKACWDMSQAMPALLKKAVELAYLKKGWDMVTSTNLTADNEFEKYPTFENLLTCLKEAVEMSDYAKEVKDNYTGSLISRVESLTNGVVGQMLCSPYDVEDSVLFDENCIVDLSRIGSSETKSLLMGLLVMRLNEYRVATSEKANLNLKHVTVLEEAHNLLPRCTSSNAGGNTLKEKSVEMLSNSIAEMRTYGEAFIIVDQSPSAVSEAAIKNTNTKIILRLPAAEDAEAVGLSVGLNDNQIHEIAKLPVGVAVTMQSNWQESVLVLINHIDENKHTATVHNPEIIRKMNTLIVEWVLMRWEYTAEQLNQHWSELISEINQLDLPLDFIKDMRSRIHCLKSCWGTREVRRAALISCLNMDGICNVIGNAILEEKTVASVVNLQSTINNCQDADKSELEAALATNERKLAEKARQMLQAYTVPIARHFLSADSSPAFHIKLFNQLVLCSLLKLQKQKQRVNVFFKVTMGLENTHCRNSWNILTWCLPNLQNIEKTDADSVKIPGFTEKPLFETLLVEPGKAITQTPTPWDKWQNTQHEAERCGIILEALGLQSTVEKVIRMILNEVDTAKTDEEIIHSLSLLSSVLARTLLNIAMPSKKSTPEDDQKRHTRIYKLLYIMAVYYLHNNADTDSAEQQTLSRLAPIFKTEATAVPVN